MEALPAPQEFGPYLVHAKIAQGGMCEVLLGTSSQKELLGQFLAIKKLLPHLNSNKSFVNLLVHEAKIGVLLNHPCIASVFDLGCYQSDFFLAMEYVHGKSLDHLLTSIEKGAPKLGIELASYIATEILRGLAFAHQLRDVKDRELNIIHRDISPGNILISFLGEVKIADFGIATAENRLQPGFSNTAMGKLSYVSPEQAANDPVTKASDIYSLAVVYHQLLTGRLPIEAKSANEIFKKLVNGNISDHLGAPIPKPLRAVILKSMDLAARNRPQSCPEFYNLLHDVLKSELNIDFTTRTSRHYYKKKLSEWMRTAFKSEIAQDLEITKRALFTPVQFELQESSMQIQEDVAVNSVEPTIYENDFAEEATRNYPLTEKEREKIMRGLPAIDVMQTKELELEELNEDTFGGISAAKVISVDDKLKYSKLTRDQKENLKEQKPSLEISSSAELEDFENSTFTGEKPKPFQNQKTKPALKIEGRVSSPSKKHRPRNRSFMRRIVLSSRMILVGCTAIIVAIVAWSMREQLIHTQSLLTSNWTEPEEVFLQILGEAPQATLSNLLTSLKDPTIVPNFSEVEELFNREYRKFTHSNKNILHLTSSNYPTALLDGLTKQNNISQLISSPLLFDFFQQKGAPPTTLPVVYIYFHTYEVKDQHDFGLPVEFSGSRKKNAGAVFASTKSFNRQGTMIALAREIAKIFGASEKRDAITKMPIFPAGFADPKLRPLFPQTNAELMGGSIPTSPLQKKQITSLREVVIGAETAYEFGWIDSESRKALMR